MLQFITRCYALNENEEKVGLKELPESIGAVTKEVISLFSEGKLRFRLREILQFYLNHLAVFKGQIVGTNKITIPKDEMDILGLKVGDHVAVLLVKIEASQK